MSARVTRVLVGCGADEVLDIIAKTFLAPGSGSVVPTPTYGMYAVLASQRDARPLPVPRLGPDDGFAIDLPAVLEQLPETGVVWLCAPNNPTGAPESAATIEAILNTGAGLSGGEPAIIINEAYVEFHPGSVLAWRERYRALIVVRTLSKAFALPGLRVRRPSRRGCPPTIAHLERVRPPGSLSTVPLQPRSALLPCAGRGAGERQCCGATERSVTGWLRSQP